MILQERSCKFCGSVLPPIIVRAVQLLLFVVAGALHSASVASPAGDTPYSDGIDYFISSAAFERISNAAEFKQAGVSERSEQVFSTYANALRELRALTREAVDRAGAEEMRRISANASLKADPAMQTRLNKLHADIIDVMVEQRSQADALTNDCITALAALLPDERRQQWSTMAADEAVVSSWRDGMRERRRATVYDVWVFDVDMFEVTEVAAAEGGELAELALTPEGQQAKAAIAAAVRSHHADMASYARAMMRANRTPSKALSRVDSTGTAHVLKPYLGIRRDVALCNRHVIDQVADALEAAGRVDLAQRWQERAWRAACPVVHTTAHWAPDVRAWAARQSELPAETRARLEEEWVSFEAERWPLLRKAYTGAHSAYLENLKGESGNDRVRQDFARAVGALWRLQADHVARVEAQLSGSPATSYRELIGREGCDSYTRVPCLTYNAYEWLVEQKLAPTQKAMNE